MRAVVPDRSRPLARSDKLTAPRNGRSAAALHEAIRKFNMKVLVTGGAGFIGSAVCRLFVAELGATVLNLDKLTYAANLASLRAIDGHMGYGFRRAAIGDRKAVSQILREFDPDAVLHLAAETHVD